MDTSFAAFGKRRACGIEFYAQKKKKDVVYEGFDPTDGGSIVQYKGMGILPIGGLTIDF